VTLAADRTLNADVPQRYVSVQRTAAVAAGVAAVGVVVWLTLDWSVFGRAWRTLAGDPLPLAGALVLYTAGFVLRSAAWGPLLPVPVPLGRRLRGIFASLAVNHALPGPVGEVARARIVVTEGLTFRGALTSVAAARVADAACLAALAIVAAVAVGSAPMWLRAVSFVALALPVAAVVVARRRGAELSVPQLVRVGLLALPSWAVELAMLWAVASAAGVRLSWAAALLATCGGLLAQPFAVLPGGVGTYEAGVTSVLVALGVPAGEALAVAVTTHAVKFAYSFGVGVPALVVR